MNELAGNILRKLPKNFDIEAASKRHPIGCADSMTTVLQQELLRSSRLVSVARTSLVNVGKAIAGEGPLSPELEAVGGSIFNS